LIKLGVEPSQGKRNDVEEAVVSVEREPEDTQGLSDEASNVDKDQLKKETGELQAQVDASNREKEELQALLDASSKQMDELKTRLDELNAQILTDTDRYEQSVCVFVTVVLRDMFYQKKI
jgi:chromosome segregation ATPase